MGAVTHGSFLTTGNLRDILENASIPAVVAAGMTPLIVAAEIDISVGAILAVASLAVVLPARAGWPIIATLAAGVAAGALLGAVNGVLSAGLRIPSIVATLATMGAIRGLLVLLTSGDTIPVPTQLTDLISGGVFGLNFPRMTVAAILICAATAVYLARTRQGRQYYAVGSNPRAAELSGLRVRWISFRSFVLLGALTGLAAFLYTCRNTPISPQPQPGFELAVITAVVVGGTDIFGGSGTVLGSALAAILLEIISVALPFVAKDLPWLRSEVQPAVQGLLILAAVLYNSLSRKE
jgi:ribose/xylose/arabinose/galactoside ABC-type transport system permease subunit